MSKLKKYLLIIISCISFTSYANSKAPYLITGVTGKLLKNIESRLNELSTKEDLSTTNQSALSNHIQQALQPYGYFRSKTQITTKDHQLQIHIIPGEPIRITQLSLRISGVGKDNPAIQKAVKNIPLKKGDPLLTETYNKTKENILNAAENEGYLNSSFAKSEILLDTKQYTAKITLIFETGDPFRFGKAIFNPSQISSKLMHKFVPFKPGETFSADKILAFNNQLSNSGYFKNIQITPQPEAGGSVPILVVTEPMPRYNYTFSAGYGTDTGVRGRAGLSIIPLNQQGHVLNLMGQGSMKENILQAQYLIPGANPNLDKYIITGSATNLHYDSGYSNSLLFSASHIHTDNRFIRELSLNSLIEKFHYKNEPNTQEYVLFPKASFSIKDTPDPLFSKTGYHVNFSFSGAHKKFLSTTNFMQLAIDAKAAWMIDPISTRLYLHGLAAKTFTPDINTLPLSLAILLGGTQNLQGYSFNSIGPGKNVLYAGVEIQKQIFPNWFVIGFYDIGDVYNPRALQLKQDIGAGLLWTSPIGPIKIGIAQPLNKHFHKSDSEGLRLVINMGADL